MEPVIRLGDLTSHGGEVISASSTVAYGKQIACVGDLVTCPLPGHDNCEIIEGSEFWKIDGRAVALQGCKTSCGAELLASFDDVQHDQEGGGAEAQAAAAALVRQHQARQEPLPQYDMHWLLKGDQTGRPLANVPYKITMEDGTQVIGKTDQNGLTKKVSASSALTATLIAPYYANDNANHDTDDIDSDCGCCTDCS